MYLQFHSVKELSKNHYIWGWVRVLFGSLRGSVRFIAHSFFNFGFGFGSWQNGKMCVLARLVLTGVVFFHISENNIERALHAYVC